MPQPTRSDVHVNKPLTNISIAYIQNSRDFVADKVFPIVPVVKQSDLYFSYDKKFWFQTQASERAPSSESAGSSYKVSATNSYFASVYAVHRDVDDQIRANADQPLDMDRDATLFVTQQLLLRREIQFNRTYLQPGIWTGDTGGDFTPSNLWSSAAGNPMQDIDTEKQKIKQQTGYMPNVFVNGVDVFLSVRNNAAVLDRIKYTQRGVVSEELLAVLFGVEKYLVAAAVQDTNPEGETNNMNFLLTRSGLLVYANPAPSILQPSGGYIFSWQGLFGAGAQGNRIMTFRMEPKKSDRVEGEMAFAMKQIGSDLGVFFKNVI